jgi:hypothetical protein
VGQTHSLAIVQLRDAEVILSLPFVIYVGLLHLTLFVTSKQTAEGCAQPSAGEKPLRKRRDEGEFDEQTDDGFNCSES